MPLLRFRAFGLALGLSFCVALPGLAQSSGPTLQALRAGIDIGADVPLDTNHVNIGHAADYRWEGAIAGAVVFGALGVFLGSLSDDDSGGGGSPVLFGFVGAAVGAGIGALVGGAIHKH